MNFTRDILSTWHRGGDVLRTISYSKIDNALARLTYHVMWSGEPGDVIEVSHRVTGMQLGIMKVRVGKIETHWVWDGELPARKQPDR